MKRERLDEIIGDLQGSCLSLYERMSDEEQDDMSCEDWDYMDNWINLCDGCGWWVETHEMGDMECQDCEEDENED